MKLILGLILLNLARFVPIFLDDGGVVCLDAGCGYWFRFEGTLHIGHKGYKIGAVCEFVLSCFLVMF